MQDDLVLIASSWTALQELLTALQLNINDITVHCSIDKTVCTVFKPSVEDCFRDVRLSGHTFKTYCLIINLCCLYLSVDILVI